MSNNIVDPRTMDLLYWADTVVFDLNNFGPIAQLDRKEDWKGWAAGLISINGISQQNPPSPYDYDNWEEWAYRFYQVLD